MAAGRGPQPNRAELEDVAVEEHHQFPPARGLASGMGQFANQVRHGFLLKLGEVNERLLGRRVAQDARWGGTTPGRPWHGRIVQGRSRFAPRGLERGVAGVPGTEPGAPGIRIGRGVAIEQGSPRILVKPFAGVLAARMVTRDMVAEFSLQMLDQGRHSGGGLATVERRGDNRMVLTRTILPSHDFIRVRLPPPIRRIGSEPRQEKSARVCVQNLGA